MSSIKSVMNFLRSGTDIWEECLRSSQRNASQDAIFSTQQQVVSALKQNDKSSLKQVKSQKSAKKLQHH